MSRMPNRWSGRDSDLWDWEPGPSRKRQRASYPSSSPAPAPWHYDQRVGIVHSDRCRTCSTYTAHLADAADNDHDAQSSFGLARQQHHTHTFEVPYNNGFVDGRHHQRQKDAALLQDRERYRIERDDARAELTMQESSTAHAHRELADLRAELDRVRAEQSRTLQPSFSVQVEEASDDAEASEIENMLLVTTEAGNSDLHAPQQYTKAEMSIKIEDSIDSSVPWTASAPAPFATDTAAYIHSDSRPPSQPPLRPTHPLPSKPVPGTSAAATSSDPIQSPDRVRLQSLIDSANTPGNHAALKQVKALCAMAHQTPANQKTELQRYLLANWRNPAWSTGTPASTPLPHHSGPPAPPVRIATVTPRADDPVDVWAAYITAHPSSWPRGVRMNTSGRPNLSDLKASRVMARLRPEVDTQDPETKALRARFTALALELFTQEGRSLSDCIASQGISVATEPVFAPYRFHGGNIDDMTLFDVAAHFAAAGFASSAPFRHWAQQYQNGAAYNPSLRARRSNDSRSRAPQRFRSDAPEYAGYSGPPAMSGMVYTDIPGVPYGLVPYFG
ncbi:hypothetical protein PLICRDRAFT_697687 [Plicaturopsis crispa FD-325 SS-3]|nr:hypothetical protein PLICRDRAFT_697687 [Plicaturopsis crispa FD-325 SS-3]